MLVGLRTKSDSYFEVFYIPSDIEFLLREEIYSQIEQKDLISQHSINQLLTYQGE